MARLIVRVEWGPLRGRKALIRPGQSIRIGRHERADLCVPGDEELSGLHFSLSWSGERCVGRDLGSPHGTIFNGETKPEAELSHGGWVQAGETFFSVYVEGRVPPCLRGAPEEGAPLDHPEPPAPALKEAALAALRAEEGSLFAVMDAARDEWLLRVAEATADEVQSLYEGEEGEELDDVAPYLFDLTPRSWALEALVREGWGLGWGIFLSSAKPFHEVRRHLRRLLVVQETETGDPLYFRFYDPKVLPVVIPLCKPRQKQEIFGDIDVFFMEGERADIVRVARPKSF